MRVAAKSFLLLKHDLKQENANTVRLVAARQHSVERRKASQRKRPVNGVASLLFQGVLAIRPVAGRADLTWQCVPVNRISCRMALA